MALKQSEDLGKYLLASLYGQKDEAQSGDIISTSNILVEKARQVIADPTKLIISDALREKYGVTAENLPLEEIVQLLPAITKIQKFGQQDTSVLLTPNSDHFDCLFIPYYGGEKRTGFIEAINSEDDVCLRWNAWFDSIYSQELKGHTQPKLFSSQIVREEVLLCARIKDINMVVLTCPIIKTIDSGRGGAPTIIVNLNSREATDKFIDCVNKHGPNFLNALFSVVMSELITPKLQITSLNNPSLRENVMEAKPVRKMYFKEALSNKIRQI